MMFVCINITVSKLLHNKESVVSHLLAAKTSRHRVCNMSNARQAANRTRTHINNKTINLT